jgi:hypothetical protein
MTMGMFLLVSYFMFFCSVSASDGPISWNWEIGEGVAWKEELPCSGWASPAVKDGKVYVVAGSSILCLKAADGSLDWSLETGEPNSSVAGTPGISSDRIVTLCGQTVFAVSPAGKELWRHKLPIQQNDPKLACLKPIVTENSVILVVAASEKRTESGMSYTVTANLIALNLANGHLMWTVPVDPSGLDHGVAKDSYAFGQPALAMVGSKHFVITSGGQVVSAVDGKVVFNGLGVSGSGGGVLAIENKVFLTGGASLKSNRPPYPTCLVSIGEDGQSTKVWGAKADSIPLRSIGWTQPIVVGDRILYAAGKSSCSAWLLDITTGQLVQRFTAMIPPLTIGMRCSATPTVAGRLVYLSFPHTDGETIRPYYRNETEWKNELPYLKPNTEVWTYAYEDGTLGLMSRNRIGATCRSNLVADQGHLYLAARGVVACITGSTARPSRQAPVGVVAALPRPKPPTGTKVRVYWLGNSLTYFSSVPHQFELLCQADGIECQTLVRAGSCATFGGYLNAKAEVEKTIVDGKLDYVVLQPYTRDPEPGLKELGAMIARGGAKGVIYHEAMNELEDWSRRGGDHNNRADKNIRMYSKLPSQHDMLLMPAALAARFAKQLRPGLAIRNPERGYGNVHQGSLGSYLFACCLFATVFDKSPENIPSYVIEDPSRKGVETTYLDPELAHFLQATAWRAHRK